MERSSWAYILQQVLVGCAWVWVLRVLWGEVRELMADLERKETS